MDVATLVASVPPNELPHLVSALEAGALVFTYRGERYAARYEKPFGWWVWRLEAGSDEHFVSADYAACTCPAPKPCKHILLLKHGGE